MKKNPEYKKLTLEILEKAIGDYYREKELSTKRNIILYGYGQESYDMFHEAMKEAIKEDLAKMKANEKE